MGQFRQVQCMMDYPCFRLFLSHQGDAGGTGPWIKFEHNGLHVALLLSAVLEPDGEWLHSVDNCTPTRKQ
jgi:hypothetical protein